MTPIALDTIFSDIVVSATLEYNVLCNIIHKKLNYVTLSISVLFKVNTEYLTFLCIE